MKRRGLEGVSAAVPRCSTPSRGGRGGSAFDGYCSERDRMRWRECCGVEEVVNSASSGMSNGSRGSSLCLCGSAANGSFTSLSLPASAASAAPTALSFSPSLSSSAATVMLNDDRLVCSFGDLLALKRRIGLTDTHSLFAPPSPASPMSNGSANGSPIGGRCTSCGWAWGECALSSAGVGRCGVGWTHATRRALLPWMVERRGKSDSLHECLCGARVRRGWTGWG